MITTNINNAAATGSANMAAVAACAVNTVMNACGFNACGFNFVGFIGGAIVAVNAPPTLG